MKIKMLFILLNGSAFVFAQSSVLTLDELDFDKTDQGLYTGSDGACFEFSLVLNPSKEELELRNQYSYKPSETVIEYFPNFNLIIANAATVWEKRKTDPNCISPNPEDCLVLCPVNIPKRVVKMEILDKTAPIDFENLDTSYQELLVHSGFAVYSEVSCDAEASTKSAVKQLLAEYFAQANISDDEFTDLLQRYQLENKLPIGGLNLETLFSMGIE